MRQVELSLVVGGAAISGTLINSFVRLGTLLYQVGQALGSAIVRMKNKKYC